MKKQILCAFVLFCSFNTNAQTVDRQVIGSSGGSFSSAALQADYTVGEVATIAGISGTFTVHQGFQQNADNTTSIIDKKSLVDYMLFPNPAENKITLSLKLASRFALKLSLTNMAGQILFADEQATQVQQTYKREIPIEAIASGVYFLNIFGDENNLLQSIRFVKQ